MKYVKVTGFHNRFYKIILHSWYFTSVAVSFQTLSKTRNLRKLLVTKRFSRVLICYILFEFCSCRGVVTRWPNENINRPEYSCFLIILGVFVHMVKVIQANLFTRMLSFMADFSGS